MSGVIRRMIAVVVLASLATGGVVGVASGAPTSTTTTTTTTTTLPATRAQWKADLASIDKAFTAAVDAATKTMDETLASATNSLEKLSARDTYAAAVEAAVTTRGEALTALGREPAKTAKSEVSIDTTPHGVGIDVQVKPTF